MSVREYIGARYVPLFMGEWDALVDYEPLCVVTHLGDSYTSRRDVPAGTSLTDETYWAVSGQYNAQVEAYRNEVRTFDGRITQCENDIDDLEEKFPIQTADIADDAITTAKIVDDAITNDKILNAAITSDKIADGSIGTDKISDDAITNDKILDGAVTSDKIANNAITTNKILDENVTVDKLSDDVKKMIFSRTASIEGTNFVVFGDSYTADNIPNSVEAYWPKKINNALGTILYNYAVAGAGFGRTGQLISAQQNACQNDMTQDEADNTSIVVCLAGCNDLLNNIPVADINTGINGFMTWAANFFKNADIFVVPYNWGFSKLTSGYNNIITNSLNSIMSNFTAQRVHVIPYAWCWNLGIAARFQNEVHPNIAGYNCIASHIMNAINGVEGYASGTGNTLRLQNASGLEDGYITYNVRNGMLFINGYVRPTASGASNVTIWAAGNTPAILTPNDSLFVLPLIDATNHLIGGNLTIFKEGRMVANFNSNVDSNDVCCFDGAFLPEVGVDWSDYI